MDNYETSSQKCSRNIHSSKYEHDDPDMRNWWYKEFDKLEARFKIPPAEREEVVKQVLPDIEDRLLEILCYDKTLRSQTLMKRQPLMYIREYVRSSRLQSFQSQRTSIESIPTTVSKMESFTRWFYSVRGENNIRMDNFLEQNCLRVIRHSKYEHDDPNSRNWWCRTFETLEGEFKIRPEERPELIKELLPDLQQNILEILGLKEIDEELAFTRKKPTILLKKYVSKRLDGKVLSVDTAERIKSEMTKRESSQGPPTKIFNLKAHCAPRVKEIQLSYVPNKVKNGTHYSFCHRREADANNPYLRFFKRGERAAIWRKLPPLSLEEMNLTQKAEAITETIAEDFVEWLRNIGGDEEPTVDVPTIIKMFEIGFNYHAATSLCVRVKEMPAVTDAIAEKRNLPEASLRVNLHKQLTSDLKSYKQKQNLVAFGKMLPLEMRTTPTAPKEDFVQKWLDCKRVPQDLATMATVWKGIENLRSTRAFCGWLLDHPEIKPPEYLEQKGMLNAEYFLGPHYSMESFEDKAHSTIGIFGEEQKLE